MRPPPLSLVPIAPDGALDRLLPRLRARLAEVLVTDVTIAPHFDAGDLTEGALDPRVAPLASNRVVDALVLRSGPNADPAAAWVLGVTSRDLVAPGRSFVFGEATLGGGWALVSTARLDSNGSAARLLARLLKESVHEIGHLRHLPHCPNERCVMHPSRDVADVDTKEHRFCESCHHRFLHPSTLLDPPPSRR